MIRQSISSRAKTSSKVSALIKQYKCPLQKQDYNTCSARNKPSESLSKGHEVRNQEKGKSKAVPQKYLILAEPLVVNNKKKKLQQPFVMDIDENNILKLGITLNMDFYADEETNLFRLIGLNKSISFRILAAGRTKDELFSCFTAHAELNPTLMDLNAPIEVKRNLNIELDPSIIMQDEFQYLQLELNELFSIFGEKMPTEESDLEDERSTASTSKAFVNGSQKICDSPSPTNYESNTNAWIDSVNENTCEITDSTLMDSKKASDPMKIIRRDVTFKRKDERKRIIESIRGRLEETMKKKELLSKLEVHGLILSSVVDIINDIFINFHCDENEPMKREVYVPVEDKTYKDKSKNLIMIEGVLPLPRDSYKQALSKAKEPQALAYQLVHAAFPDSYVKGVTLGKSHFTLKELSSFKEAHKNKEKMKKDKFPLAFVFGFQNPLDNPYEGDFDPKLGVKRLKCFFGL